MIRGPAKTRAVIALILLAVPYLLLFTAGSIWLFQNRLLLGWGSISLACTAAGWVLARSVGRTVKTPEVQPDLAWPPQGMQVWNQVETLAANIEGEEHPLDRPEEYVGLVRRVLDLVAGHYHPGAKEPWLETPVPDVLKIVELVAGDLRRATLGYVPGSHILSIADLRRLQKLAGVANRSYFWYRVASFVVNTPASFVREARDAIFGQLRTVSTNTARRWAIGYFVRRTGYYAIQLYGRQTNLDAEQSAASPPTGPALRQSQRDARDERARSAALDSEPLRILVAGQTKAGKSSLVNALFGEHRAATDVVPRTDRIEPYLLESHGLAQALVLDTPGYDLAASGEVQKSMIAHLHGCDILLVVCSAASAAREADRRFLSEVRAEFQRHPDRHLPVLITALTHIDRLRPVQEWSPPYRLDPAEGLKAEQIADAIRAVASDLAVPPDDVLPICLLPERVYNVEEALVPALLERLPAARRVKYVRCLRQRRDEEYWRRLWKQTLAAGRVLFGAR
jgi:uncharacterized protein